ncbi:hypothetical protein ACN3E9_12970 [Vibrio pectenicida]|uniref:hypothetical protein n=1 Tax=Vibrio pectenicida TaxID=62763 RepID=UPI003B9CB4D4
MKYWFSLIILFLAFHAQSVEVFTTMVQGLHEKKGGGAYDKMINTVNGTSLTPLPTARAVMVFNGSQGCLSPANKDPNFYSDYANDAFIESKPMGEARVYIFTSPNKEAISELSKLQGKKVGARIGFDYGKNVESSGVKLIRTKEIQQKINKLLAGRIDAIIDFTPDMLIAFEVLKMDPLPYVTGAPLDIHEDRVLCKNTPDNERFIQQLNNQMHTGSL